MRNFILAVMAVLGVVAIILFTVYSEYVLENKKIDACRRNPICVKTINR